MSCEVRAGIVQKLCEMLKSYSNTAVPCVLCALSGGKDSVGLLATLAGAEQHNSDYLLYAGYVNHGVQEYTAQKHEFETVHEVCTSLRLPLYAVSLCCITPYVCVSEAYLRQRRYEALCAMARSCGAQYIVTAHHRADVYESVLMRLFTHGAWQGLSGIPLMRKIHGGSKDVVLLRPALDVQSSFFHAPQFAHHVDSSNADTRYKRNALRNDVIPAIDRHFPNSAARVHACSHQLSQLRTFVQATTAPWLTGHEHLMFSFHAFTMLSHMQQNHLLFMGANALGVSQVSHAFLEECRKSLLRDMSSIRIKDTILMKCGQNMVWRRMCIHDETEHMHNDESSRKTFLVNRHCSLFYTKSDSWVFRTDDELQKSDCLSYDVVVIPPVHIAFLKKSDIIVQEGLKLNVLSMLNSSVQKWIDIPIICDREGVVCVAGEALLTKTLCRLYDRKRAVDDTMKLCTVSIAYHVVDVVLNLNSSLINNK